MDYSDIKPEYITRIDTLDRYYTGIIGTDTSWIYVTEENKFEISNKEKVLSDLTYKYLSIPLFFGYSKNYKKITFEFKGGLLFNYYLGSKGFFLSISPDSTIQVNKTKAPASNFNIDIYGAIAVDYFLNEKVHIFVQPYLGYTSFSPGNKNINYYSTNFQVGINTGFRFFFK